MHRTRSITAAVVAVLALVATACGGDEEADETTTTAAGEQSTTTVEPLSDEEFLAEVEQVTSSIEAAGNEFCAVIEAASAPGPTAAPDGEAQVRATVEAQVGILEAIAAAEPVDEENAAVLRETAAQLAQAAEDAGYSEDFIQGEASAEILLSDEFNAAITAYQTRRANECADPGADGAEGGADGADATTTTGAPADADG